jgi:hypothetical protein
MKKFYITTITSVRKAFIIRDDEPGSIASQGVRVPEVVKAGGESAHVFNMESDSTLNYILLVGAYNKYVYKLKDLIDITTVVQGLNRSTIIVNVPSKYAKFCAIKFPPSIVNRLRVPEYVRLLLLDKREHAKENQLDNRGLMARGILPDGHSWFAMMIYNTFDMEKDEWDELCNTDVRIYLSEDTIQTHL